MLVVQFGLLVKFALGVAIIHSYFGVAVNNIFFAFSEELAFGKKSQGLCFMTAFKKLTNAAVIRRVGGIYFLINLVS